MSNVEKRKGMDKLTDVENEHFTVPTSRNVLPTNVSRTNLREDNRVGPWLARSMQGG